MRKNRTENEATNDENLVKPEMEESTGYGRKTVLRTVSAPQYPPPPFPQGNSLRSPRTSNYITKETVSEVDGKPKIYAGRSEEKSRKHASKSGGTARKHESQTSRKARKYESSSSESETESESTGYEKHVSYESKGNSRSRKQEAQLAGYKPRSEGDPFGDTKDNSVQLHVILRHDQPKPRPVDKQGRVSYETKADVKSELSDNVAMIHLPTLPELPDVSREMNGGVVNEESKSPSKRRKKRSRRSKVQPSESSD